MILEQSATRSPFPWELIPFAKIAGRASQYKVVDTIGWDSSTYYSAEWERMFNMVDILTFGFLESGMAVVALMLLPPQLVLDLSTGMLTSNAFFSCSISMAYCLIHSLVLLIMPFMASSSVFFMRLIVSFTLLRHMIFIGIIVLLVVLFVLFFMCIVPDFLTCKALASDCGSHAILFASFALTFLALIVKSKALRFIAIKKLFSQWMNIFASRTAFISFCWLLRCLYAKVLATSTSFTDEEKPVFIGTIFMEVSRSCRKTIRALFTLLEGNIDVLGYNITHGKGRSFSSRLQMLLASWGQKHVQFMGLLYHKLAWRASL